MTEPQSAKAYTVAFHGIEARLVEVQCALSDGLPSLAIVGLPDKAVSEARERVRAALSALSIAFPMKRITINLSPASLPKEGAHFDLPIALAILAAMDVVPRKAVARAVALGELSLDGALMPVRGALPAALRAVEEDKNLICPAQCGGEAAWVEACTVIAPATLLAVIKHLTDQRPLPPAMAQAAGAAPDYPDLRDVRGQERAKRALEIVAAGGHHLLMVGPPGGGKSMLAARLPGLLPPSTPQEMLESSAIHSIAGELAQDGLCAMRPFRAPHHSASVAAIAGGGRMAGPGEISLSHNGVLFLDEMPEFPRNVIEVLRQPLETGEITISRANAHLTYPAKFILLGAANPCRCGHLADPARACSKAPRCGQDYIGRLSGPILDRFDMHLTVPPVNIDDMSGQATGEASATVAARVAAAREVAERRQGVVNAQMTGDPLLDAARLGAEEKALLNAAAERLVLSARGYFRVLRVARTIADLDGADATSKTHLSEALSFRSMA